VAGRIPGRKDPRAVDRKLMERRELDLSRWARARRRAGEACLQCIRFGRSFALPATAGRHRSFKEEAEAIRAARRSSIRFGGLAISLRAGHRHVRIEQNEFNTLKRLFPARALRWPGERLESEFRSLPYESYDPVRRQLLIILRQVNRARKTAGCGPVPMTCLRLKRQIDRPFDEVRTAESG
jgi:hypothetical protein